MKHALDQESYQEKTITAKKKERKHALDQEIDQEKTITAKKKTKENTPSTKKATFDNI